MKRVFPRPPSKEPRIANQIIAIAGKGGVGKTTISVLMLKSFIQQGIEYILMVDADPATNVPDLVGVKNAKTVADATDWLHKNILKLPPEFDKNRWLESQVFRVLVEEDDFDLLTLGAIEKEGCYCMINNMLTQILDATVENYPLTIMDMVAGLEHLNRRTAKRLDALYIVTDASQMGLHTARRINELVPKVHIEIGKTFLVANRLESRNIEEKIAKFAAMNNLTFVASVPFDPLVQEFNFEGKPLLELPEDSKAYQVVRDIVKRTFLPKLIPESYA
ncbi:MAG: P-loop NTPase [Candidatus Heimdallarchaeota archaeon]